MSQLRRSSGPRDQVLSKPAANPPGGEEESHAVLGRHSRERHDVHHESPADSWQTFNG